jgi:hypothetical protein
MLMNKISCVQAALATPAIAVPSTSPAQTTSRFPPLFRTENVSDQHPRLAIEPRHLDLTDRGDVVGLGIYFDSREQHRQRQTIQISPPA